MRENGPKRPSHQDMSQEVFKQILFENKFTRFWRGFLAISFALNPSALSQWHQESGSENQRPGGHRP